jgi:hypothetical protein
MPQTLGDHFLRLAFARRILQLRQTVKQLGDALTFLRGHF